MKNYVKFSDGHIEEILDGYAFDDVRYPRSIHHVIAHTHSGCYRKSVHKDSRFGKIGSTECVGYGVTDQTPHPVAISGYNGVIDVVIDGQDTYKYIINHDEWVFSGAVVVPKDADIRDVHSAIMREFERVQIVKIEE